VDLLAHLGHDPILLHPKQTQAGQLTGSRPVTVALVARGVSVAVVAVDEWASGEVALGPSSGVVSLRDFGVIRDLSLMHPTSDAFDVSRLGTTSRNLDSI
jgi:hypothetical protein